VSRARRVVLVLAASLLVAALGLAILLQAPARSRPPGWKDPWARLPLEPEGSWTADPLKRGVVQASFFSATDSLTACLQKYPAPGGVVIKLELLVETEHGGTHLEYVESSSRPDLPEGLVSCVTRVLEQGAPVLTPGVAEGTRWRLELAFLLPQPADLPPAPWWRRFLPDAWHSRHLPGNDVG
jgi:hypothetical protein